MKEFMSIAKALSDENRTRVLMFLRSGELCVCKVLEMLQLAPSTVSKHLNILQQAGLVESRKQGRWVYYRLPQKPTPCIREALRWVHTTLEGKTQIRHDAKRLAAVNKMDVEKLCDLYRK